MPLYEYKCQSCQKEVEAIQKFSDAPLKECPECGVSALERVTSKPSFQLKGGGWYKDGYSNEPTSAGSSTNS